MVIRRSPTDLPRSEVPRQDDPFTGLSQPDCEANSTGQTCGQPQRHDSRRQGALPRAIQWQPSPCVSMLDRSLCNLTTL
jgi:hypothetical protein